jgi:hemerythrin
MYFKWKDEFSTGIETIDKQHRHLLEIGARIYDLADANDGVDHYDEIMAVLSELKDYTVYHFGYEEKLMDQYGYEHYETHKFQHFFVIKKIDRFENEDIDNKQKETILDLVQFIFDWITNHILKEDMAYKDFFISKGIK